MQGELISARRWNFWVEDGQVFGVQLLNGLDCHCKEFPSADTGKPRKNHCKEGTSGDLHFGRKVTDWAGLTAGEGRLHCQMLLPWSR